MARIFITGSAEGLGMLAAKSLIQMGHSVVLHARNEGRAKDAMKANPEAESVLVADLCKTEETKDLARQVNELGIFDAVIHNAGVYQVPAKQIFRVNTLAPYILTCLIHRPKRLVYLSSGMHLYGHSNLDNFTIDQNQITYSDSKMHVVMLCIAIARKWKDTYANAVDPGWVPTKMGGRGAPDNLKKGYETQVWLAVSNDEKAKVSGRYFFHQSERNHNPECDEVPLQEKFLDLCEQITDVSLV